MISVSLRRFESRVYGIGRLPQLMDGALELLVQHLVQPDWEPALVVIPIDIPRRDIT